MSTPIGQSSNTNSQSNQQEHGSETSIHSGGRLRIMQLCNISDNIATLKKMKSALKNKGIHFVVIDVSGE